ncbi:MAG: sulfide/dihydroorotate dehydrogenase-like FAD/NAD-binding protein [Kiritimatiellae bacterium]|nr:sulfide/dihydroorotate dehydrogenase-like FAD/NAD-binding protein [Kiritimatiellia bacterium]
MNPIAFKEEIAEEVFMLRVHAPMIARERRPGQFVILQVDPVHGERIPLTIVDADRKESTITLIFEAVGKTTHLLADLQVGDSIPNMVGPLGNPTDISKVGTVVCVGGGIGVAALYPIAKAIHEAGNRTVTIVGARARDLLILEREMRGISDEFILCTDDGSAGRKALVTEPLQEACDREPRPDQVIAIGPPVMMKFCAETTRPYRIPTVVSLNAIMIDGTGLCGGCRVTVGGQTRFTCVDGPEFDGHLVDFDNLMQRLGAHREQEEEAHRQYHADAVTHGRAERQTRAA